MTELTSAFAGLADLVGLGACDRIELRPALLRVLTDLYLPAPGTYIRGRTLLLRACIAVDRRD